MTRQVDAKTVHFHNRWFTLFQRRITEMTTFSHMTRVVSSRAVSSHVHFIGLSAELPDTSNSKLLHKKLKLPAWIDTTEVNEEIWLFGGWTDPLNCNLSVNPTTLSELLLTLHYLTCSALCLQLMMKTGWWRNLIRQLQNSQSPLCHKDVGWMRWRNAFLCGDFNPKQHSSCPVQSSVIHVHMAAAYRLL